MYSARTQALECVCLTLDDTSFCLILKGGKHFLQAHCVLSFETHRGNCEEFTQSCL
ncbi:hypothetical protein ACRRTK_007946 [Alexandromys fortis]